MPEQVERGKHLEIDLFVKPNGVRCRIFKCNDSNNAIEASLVIGVTVTHIFKPMVCEGIVQTNPWPFWLPFPCAS